MKLTQQNIQFIDNYLKNNEVVYFDIRMEMLDHIATAVEQKMELEDLDFYDAFKNYMVSNKKEILNGNKDGTGVSYSKEVIINFLKFIIKPYMLMLLLVVYFFFQKVEVANYFSNSFSINNLFFVCIVSVALFQIFYFYMYLKERFFVIEKVGGLLALLYYAQIFFFPAYGKEIPSSITMVIFFYLLFAYIIYFINEILIFKKKNKLLYNETNP